MGICATSAAGGLLASADGSQPASISAVAANAAASRRMPVTAVAVRSAQNAAVPVVDQPSVEACNTEFDIVADAYKAHAVLDQVPDRTVAPVRKRGGRPAIAPRDRPVFTVGQVAVLVDPAEIGDIDVRQ